MFLLCCCTDDSVEFAESALSFLFQKRYSVDAGAETDGDVEFPSRADPLRLFSVVLCLYVLVGVGGDLSSTAEILYWCANEGEKKRSKAKINGNNG